MIDDKHNELISRISALVKENNKLKQQAEELSLKIESLTTQNEALKEEINSEGQNEKEKSHTQSLRFKMATVLYANVVGFGTLHKEDDPQQLIDHLDEVFRKFDKIADKYKIQKIKSIGDTYICAGGVPLKNNTNPIDVVMAALEMQQFLDALRLNYENEGKKFWDMKIGIHTGPVVAVVSGKKKISYELKGETLNIASRMEAASLPGKINISVMTYELVRDYFTCDYNGKMPVKYQGGLEMYFVRRIKKMYSKEREGIIPNEAFRTKYGLRQFADLQEIILDKLEKELPAYLYYHNVKHTIDVITQAELIGWGEGITDEEILLIKTAALFHDTGQIYGSKDHEFNSTQIAREILPDYSYSNEQIDEICSIIMATKLPPQPETLLQRIICDSDLDYLGRSDFIPVSNTLYKELNEQGLMGSINDWNKIQVKFLSSHQFFTNTAKTLREINKQEQIDRISKLIEED
ncbi:MAG: HD domain-containing protein [Bacteroidales bacterium]|nr:HD domain-containing protein [Bacteroidales bacterium]